MMLGSLIQPSVQSSIILSTLLYFVCTHFKHSLSSFFMSCSPLTQVCFHSPIHPSMHQSIHPYPSIHIHPSIHPSIKCFMLSVFFNSGQSQDIIFNYLTFITSNCTRSKFQIVKMIGPNNYNYFISFENSYQSAHLGSS